MCGFCKSAKAFLESKGITYKDFNVAKDERARDEMIAKSDSMSVSVIIVSKDGTDEVLIGFDQSKLSKAIGLEL